MAAARRSLHPLRMFSADHYDSDTGVFVAADYVDDLDDFDGLARLVVVESEALAGSAGVEKGTVVRDFERNGGVATVAVGTKPGANVRVARSSRKRPVKRSPSWASAVPSRPAIRNAISDPGNTEGSRRRRPSGRCAQS